MTECNNSKIHISSNFLLSMSYNNVGHLITSTIITLQHFATLHHTSLDDECGAIVELYWLEENELLGEKPVLLSLYSPQI